MVSRDSIIAVYSDLHKDVYGFRPSGSSYDKLVEMSDQQLNDQYDYLCERLQQVIEEERIATNQSIAAFETRIAKLANQLKVDRLTIIRWEIESDYNYRHDIDFYRYDNQLPYTYDLKIRSD